MDDPDSMTQNLQLAETNIKQLLRGETPRLIDEWQIAPQLWDAIRFEVDHRRDDGQFMLTGSAVPADDSKIHHTGTGRFAWLTMRPMTLWESGESTGDVSLGKLFENAEMVEGESHLSLEDVAFITCRGGWPKAMNMKRRDRFLFHIPKTSKISKRTKIDGWGQVQKLSFGARPQP